MSALTMAALEEMPMGSQARSGGYRTAGELVATSARSTAAIAIRTSAPSGRPQRRRRSSHEVDRLRARALLGDQLVELGDGEREWVWRSLLNGIRIQQSAALAGLNSAEIATALANVRAAYERRISTYKRRSRTQAQMPGADDVRRKPSGWWPFRRS